MESNVLEKNEDTISTYDFYNSDKYTHKTKEELVEIFSKIRSGSKEVREEFILSNMRLIGHVIEKMPYISIPKDDLIQTGIIGLIKSIDIFDISRDINFSTLAVKCIFYELSKYIGENSGVLRKSQKFIENCRKIKKLIKENNYQITDEEIIEKLQITKNTLNYYKLSEKIPFSFDEYKNDESDNPSSLYEEYIPVSKSVEILVEEKIQKENILISLDYLGLSKRDQNIILVKFGFDDDYFKSDQEVANYFGGEISRERVRQIVSRNIAKLFLVLNESGYIRSEKQQLVKYKCQNRNKSIY